MPHRRLETRLGRLPERVAGLRWPTRGLAAAVRRGAALVRWPDDQRRLEAARRKPPEWRTLADLAVIHRSDKGRTVGARHCYAAIYDRLFEPLRGTPDVAILEIGLRFDPYYLRRRRISPSLAMWRDYFASGQIYGFDINDFSEMAGERMHIFQGDQGEARDLARVADAVVAFEIVIDDGSHASYHQLISLRTLLPKVRCGGYYIVEDLHYSPPALEATLPPTRPMRLLLRDDAFLATLGLDRTAVRFAASGKLGIITKPGAL